MEEMDNFIVRMKEMYPFLNFREGEKFAFRPERTIIYEPMAGWDEQNNYQLCFLHEIGHAILKHWDFKTDPERLKMERAAWEKARELALGLGVEYDEDLVEERLDSYRNWLHRRSSCPKCGLTRFQTAQGAYVCPQCDLMA